MASDLKVQRIIPPYLGLDTDSAPELVRPERAVVHRNWMLDRPGKCMVRGSLLRKLPGVTNAGAATLIGFPVWDDSIAWIGFGAGATPVIYPWESFWKFATVVAPNGGQLPFGSSAPTITDLQASTNTTPALAASYIAGWGPGTRLGNRIFQPSISNNPIGTTELVQGHNRRPTLPVAWDGGVLAGSFTNPWAQTAAPNFTIAARSHYSRLFICAARDPSAASGNAPNYSAEYNPHQIYWTNPVANGSLFAGAYTDWRNPVSLMMNKATVGQQDEGDACMWFGKVGRNMAIFKRFSTYVLYGYGEDTWNIRQVSGDLGCLDPRSVVESDDKVYFMSAKGFYSYDGAQFRDVGGLNTAILRRLATKRCGPQANQTYGGFVRAASLSGGYIQVAIGQQNFSGGADTIDFLGYYCPQTDAWSNLSVPAGAAAGNQPWGGMRTQNFHIMHSGTNFWDGSNTFYPENQSAAAYGFDQHPTTGAQSLIDAAFVTKLYQLASPLYDTQLQRFLIEYMHKLNAGADDSAAGFVYSLVNGVGTALAQGNMLAAGAATSHAYRRRTVADVYTEAGNAGDAQLAVQLGTGGASKAEVYAADILYQAAQERRSQ